MVLWIFYVRIFGWTIVQFDFSLNVILTFYVWLITAQFYNSKTNLRRVALYLKNIVTCYYWLYLDKYWNGKCFETSASYIGTKILLDPAFKTKLLWNFIGDFLHATMSRGHGGLQSTMKSFLKHLDYADGICLLSQWITELGQALYLEKEESRVGLKINTIKTQDP